MTEIEIWKSGKSFFEFSKQIHLGKIPKFKKITFIPLLILDEKWILVKLDKKIKTLTIFNPYGTSLQESHEYLIDFLLILQAYNKAQSLYAKSRKIDEIGWKVVMEDHPKAVCPLESGLLILYLLDIMTTKHLSHKHVLQDNLDLKNYSSFLKQLLLKYSSNVSEFCPICKHFEDPKKPLKWVKCELCQRWIHFDCDKRDFHNVSSLESPRLIYYCPICSAKFNTTPYIDHALPAMEVGFLKNGLIKNLNYYVASNKLGNYVIACYESTFDLTIEDYGTLNQESYISNTVFYIYVQLLYNDSLGSKIKIWSIYKTGFIFHELDKLDITFYEDDMFLHIKEKINLIPILWNSHFTLVVVDFENKTFSYLDPMGTTEESTKKMFDKFTKFAQKLNIYNNLSNKILVNELRIATINHVKQKDSYNCGIYVLKFIKSISNRKPLSIEFDPNEERNEIKLYLVEKSVDMTNICLKCGKTIMNNENVSHCKICKRICENTCCMFEDTCPLCQNYYVT